MKRDNFMKIQRVISSEEYPDAVVLCFEDSRVPSKLLHPNDLITIDGVDIRFKGIRDGVADFGVDPGDMHKLRKSRNQFLQSPIDDSAIKVSDHWIASAKAIYGDMYDYSHAIYSGQRTSIGETTVLIECRRHGQVTVGHRSHLGVDPVTGKSGYTPLGCKRCPPLPTRSHHAQDGSILLASQICSIFEGHGHYKLEFTCDNIPSDWRCLAGFQVAGGQYYRNQAQAFIKALPVFLELKRDYNNPHDVNAIKVIGVSSDNNQHMIGHVPADYAERIISSGSMDEIWPALHLAQISRNGFTFVKMALYGKYDLRRLIATPYEVEQDARREVQRKIDEEAQALRQGSSGDRAGGVRS